jgi:TolA-binding protein
MNSVGEVGSLASKSESVDDITSSYVDVQARLKSLNTKLERLQELEEQADNIEDLLSIEDRINEVQYQIESYTAQKKAYDDQIDYSTVSIDITEVSTYSEVKADTAWNRFVEAFSGSFSGFVAFIQAFVIAIIYLLPYLILIAIILCIIFFVRKKKGKGFSFKKKDKKTDQS